MVAVTPRSEFKPFFDLNCRDMLEDVMHIGGQRELIESNPILAMAAVVTIAEVDEIVEVGELDPEIIVTSETFVDRIVKIAEVGFGSTSYMQGLFRSTMRALLQGEKE